MQRTSNHAASAGRLLRVDLSDAAPDFRFVASEPGLPLLDQGGTNYALVKMWLGRFAAEPQRQADSTIAFFIQGDEPGRVSQFTAAPVTRDDLQGPLKDEWNALRAKLAKAKPATSSERALRDALRRAADALAADNAASEPDYALFKYRQGREPWRLVWCWGYQRADAQPAPAVLCTNPDCQQLFLRRPGGDGRCPGCADVVEHKVAAARRGSRKSLAALLVLLALLGLIYFGGQHRLTVTPASWEGPIGSRVAFHVTDRSWFWHEEDVTGRTTPLAHDTRVIRFEPHDCVGIAPGVGSTHVSFHYGGLSTDVEVVALPADGLTGFCLAPAVIDLASGSTAELKALAKDAKGREHDLTASVDWQSLDPAVALARPGLVEGADAGETVVEVRYVPKPGAAPLLAQASVSVQKVDFSALSLKLAPSELAIGQRARVEVFADTDVARYSFAGSSQLALSVDPASIAKVEGDGAVALVPGKAEVQAAVGDLKATAPLVVSAPPAAANLVVKPLAAKLAVGERLKLDVLAPGSEPLAAASADPKIVSTPSPRELLGEAAGTTEVRITQGKQEQVVKVKVEPAAIESLRIGPAQLTVNVGTTAPLRVIGTLAGGREIDLDPDSLTWVKQPLADRAKFDRQALLVTGLAPTDESEPLEVHYQDLSAKAEVKVQGDPKRVLLAGDFLAHPPIVTGGKMVDAATSGADATGTPTVVGPKVAGTDTPAVTVPATGDVPAGAPVVTTGPYLGDSVALRDGKLVVGDTAADSALAVAGIAPGSVVTGVNGTKLEGLAPEELVKYFADHPVVAGDELAFRTPAGKAGQAILGDRFEAVQDVKLVGVEFNDVSAKDFAAGLRVAVRERGEYRISDGRGKALSDWQKLDAGATALLPAGKISRAPDDEYELFVERKIGGQTRRFQIPFRLKAEKP